MGTAANFRCLANPSGRRAPQFAGDHTRLRVFTSQLLEFSAREFDSDACAERAERPLPSDLHFEPGALR